MRDPPPADPSKGAPSRRRHSDWTVGELLAWVTERFEQAQIPHPRVDAEHLLAAAADATRMELYLRHHELADAPTRARLREMVRRRLEREPVAYILGRRGFHALDLELAVDRRVLVPRPETEHLVDWLLAELPTATPEESPQPGPGVLDVGTGSGAIALAVAHARPDAHVVAVDISEDALALARTNAQTLELRVTFERRDLATLGSAPPPAGAPFAAVAANLPYIPSSDIDGLAPEVARYEPRAALDGGPDGLDPFRALAPALPTLLAPGGAAYLEVGMGQAEAVAALLAAHGLDDVQVRKDHAQIPRVVRARRP